ncbi:MAG: DUF4339 domain-containing protein [Opitutales bacterium]
MRQFSLFINDQVRGPHAEAEIVEMIARGELTPQTLCAPDGSTEWEPLSSHFSFGSKLKVSRAKQEGESAAETRADVAIDQRRKLLVYGLADSVSIDQFERGQAQQMIDAHERKLRARIARHRWAGVGGLAGGVLLGLYLGLRTPLDVPIVAAAATALKPEDKPALVQARNLDREVAQFAKLKAQVEAISFSKPAGGMLAGPVLTARLKTDPARAFRVIGHASLAPLSERVGKWRISLDGSARVIVLPSAMSPAIAEKVAAQSAVLETVLSPMLDDARFEEYREELLRGLPELAGNSDSDKLRNDLKKLKVSELATAAARVDFRAAQAAANPATRGWSVALKQFADKIRELHARVRINVDPEARRKMWSDFNAGPGAELAAWALAIGGKEVILGSDGMFRLEEVAKLDEAAAIRQVLVVTRINGDPVHLPWGSPFMIHRELRSEPLPVAPFLLREREKVVDKPVAGDRRLAAKLRVGGKELVVERRSPRWYYLSVAREKDPDTVLLLVDEQTQARYKVGQEVPMSVLLKSEMFMRPAESALPPVLSPVQ